MSSGASTILFSSASAYFTSLHDRDVGRLVLVELRRIDVDVDDLAVLAELLDLAGHAVVEPHAERDQQIGLFDRVVRVHACRACRACRATADRRPGNAPRPITVIVTGMPVFLASVRSSSLASPLMTPPPA